MNNFDIQPDTLERPDFIDNVGNSVVRGDEGEDEESEKDVGVGIEGRQKGLEKLDSESKEKLSPDAISYIQHLESELFMVKQELYTEEKENLRMENINKSNEDLLEYLRSLESDMVSELSRPSSPEVKEVIYQLAQNTLRLFLKDNFASDCLGSLTLNSIKVDRNIYDTINTSRDHLAKLLFWCMLLGHHLRGLENRLHLSCVIGLV